jgi:hypothetical protein
MLKVAHFFKTSAGFKKNAESYGESKQLKNMQINFTKKHFQQNSEEICIFFILFMVLKLVGFNFLG